MSLFDDASLEINPANGFVMVDDSMDIAGNPCGFDSSDDFTELDESSIGLDYLFDSSTGFIDPWEL